MITLFEVGNLDVTDSLPHITEGSVVDQEYEADKAEVEIKDENKDLETEGNKVDILVIVAEKADNLVEEHETIADQAHSLSPEEVVEKQQVFQSGIESIAGMMGARGEDLLKTLGVYTSGLNSVTPDIYSYKAGIEGIKDFAYKLHVKIKAFITKIVQWLTRLGLKALAWFRNYEKKAEKSLEKVKEIKGNMDTYDVDKGIELPPVTKILYRHKLTFENSLETMKGLHDNLKTRQELAFGVVNKIGDKFRNKVYERFGTKKEGSEEYDKDAPLTNGSESDPKSGTEIAKMIMDEAGLKNPLDKQSILASIKDGELKSINDVLDAICTCVLFQEGRLDIRNNKLQVVKEYLANKDSLVVTAMAYIGFKNQEESAAFLSPATSETATNIKKNNRYHLGEIDYEKLSFSGNLDLSPKPMVDYLEKLFESIKGSNKKIKDIIEVNLEQAKKCEKFASDGFNNAKKDSEDDGTLAKFELRTGYLLAKQLRESCNLLINQPNIYINAGNKLLSMFKKKGE